MRRAANLSPTTLSANCVFKTLVTATLCLAAWSSAAQTSIRISTQPGLYFALPLHVATANGY